MGRGAIYVLLPVFLALVLVAVIAAVVVWVRARDKARAIRLARWETYSEMNGDGRVEIGIRRMARWGYHELEVKRSATGTTAYADAMRVFDLQVSAESQRDFANGLLPPLEDIR